MRIAEIFYSLQGESSYSGKPCIFLRLSGCNLSCSYCDTQYAQERGEEIPIADILGRLEAYACPLVEITGGEPLLQEDVYPLCDKLLHQGYTVLLETNGSQDISRVPQGVVRIMDIKCPGSRMSGYMCWENIPRLEARDEVKFVISSRDDYTWARGIMSRYELGDNVLMSPAYGALPLQDLASWIIADRLPVRFQIQLQKYIWGPDRRGV